MSIGWVIGKKRSGGRIVNLSCGFCFFFLLVMSKSEGNLLLEEEAFNTNKMVLIKKQLKSLIIAEGWKISI